MLHDYLYEFSLVAGLGGVSAAAAQLGVAQSTLTRHLAALRDELGAELFERHGSGIRLTQAGREAAEAGAAMRSLGDELGRHFASSSLRARQRAIVVAGLTDAWGLASLLSNAAERLRLSNIDADLHYLELGAVDDAGAALALDTCDLVLAYGPTASPQAGEVSLRELGSLALAAVVPEAHPLARRAAVRLGDLVGCSFVRPSGPGIMGAALWQEFARSAGGRGLPLTCRTLGSGMTPNVSDFGPNEVLVVCAQTSQRAQYVGDGLASVPIVDARVPIGGIARADDEVACRLLDEAYAIAQSAAGA